MRYLNTRSVKDKKRFKMLSKIEIYTIDVTMNLNDAAENPQEINKNEFSIDTYATATEKISLHQEVIIILLPCLNNQVRQQVNTGHK